jgi:hypothetical protein
MEYFGYFASVIIGLSLGLIGGGGSIHRSHFSISFKVYRTSNYLFPFIVGVTAMIGSFSH